VRRQATEQGRLERAQASRAAAARADVARRRRVVRSDYEAWLDERDTARAPTRAELHSQSDEIAVAVVASGGGIDVIVDATDLRTRENVLWLIDPAILVRAFTNDTAAAAAAEPSRDRLRHLAPDPPLLHRRAAGETLRALARDYQVAHTTLARYLKRPDVARQLRATRQLAAASRKHQTTPA
jgi:hypothetical protein